MLWALVTEVKRSTLKTKRSHIHCWLLGAILVLQGCTVTSTPDYASLGLVKVAGTVTLDGVPLSNVEVRLENVEESIYSYGITDESGRFELMFDSRTPGIIPGRKRVRIVERRKSEKEMSRNEASSESNENAGPSDEQSASNAVSSVQLVPDCYGKDPSFFVQIVGATSRLALDLRSDCSGVEASR